MANSNSGETPRSNEKDSFGKDPHKLTEEHGAPAPECLPSALSEIEL